ncbi:hypothetical protein PRIPAC_72403 [Pristionchus pacificus]|uniref:Innexin n=1 Tax=Pristionchus pacificus TaxID=54126 RepID=A0A2A6BFC7_PRIPA|nr:hypothetical protein PRIPAC_72403 [Pristionchus pacificus]|eukprot:PDM64566.1 Innexin [Pristionchus pacificus]
MATLFNTIVSTVPFIQSKFQRRTRSDFKINNSQADRLNTRFTVMLLAVTSALLGSAHVWGQPITCWTPAQFQPHWSVFVDQGGESRYCYTHGTYFVPFEDDLTQDSSVRHQYRINYYQWVPYILGVQALLFCIPHLLRKFIKSYLEYDVPGVIEHVEGFWASIKVVPELPMQITAFENGPAIFVWEGLRLSRRHRCLNLARCHALATLVQAVIAWMLASVLHFLWLDYVFGGPLVILDVIVGKDWLVTGHFPRTVHCDFQRRALASSQLETVLCMLHLNIYYEKVLLFLWLWVQVLDALCCHYLYGVDLHQTGIGFKGANISFFTTNSEIIQGRAKVFKLLEFAAEGESTPSTDRFIRVLGSDGLFVLQQIALNLGNLPASYLAAAMRNCCKRYENEDKMEPKLLEV